MTIRPYRDSDFESVREVWRQSMVLDSLTPAGFVQRVLLDQNFDPKGFLVAETEGRVVGFLLALLLRHPIEKTGYLEKRAFVTAFGVDPNFRRLGIGSALFQCAEEFFRARDRTEIVVAPYPPNYIIPGVDREHYAPAVSFLEKHGFHPYLEALAMDALIGQFTMPGKLQEREAELQKEGVCIELLNTGKLTAFLEFMTEVMPGDWVEAARKRLKETAGAGTEFESVLVAQDRGRIIGYCQFEGEHFGPFGIAEAHQGRGIGSVLLARTLLQMRQCGYHSAYVLWTGERAARGIYSRLGFRITRRFGIFKKQLS